MPCKYRSHLTCGSLNVLVLLPLKWQCLCMAVQLPLQLKVDCWWQSILGQVAAVASTRDAAPAVEE
jgi:hypothetical protein